MPTHITTDALHQVIDHRLNEAPELLDQSNRLIQSINEFISAHDHERTVHLLALANMLADEESALTGSIDAIADLGRTMSSVRDGETIRGALLRRKRDRN